MKSLSHHSRSNRTHAARVAVVATLLIAAVYVDQQRRAAALRGGRPKMLSTILLDHLLTSRQAAQARELPCASRAS